MSMRFLTGFHNSHGLELGGESMRKIVAEKEGADVDKGKTEVILRRKTGRVKICSEEEKRD